MLWCLIRAHGVSVAFCVIWSVSVFVTMCNHIVYPYLSWWSADVQCPCCNAPAATHKSSTATCQNFLSVTHVRDLCPPLIRLWLSFWMRQNITETYEITYFQTVSFLDPPPRPLPAITFDEFVMVTKAIELVLPQDSDIQKALDLFKRDFGMNWLVRRGWLIVPSIIMVLSIVKNPCLDNL